MTIFLYIILLALTTALEGKIVLDVLETFLKELISSGYKTNYTYLFNLILKEAKKERKLAIILGLIPGVNILYMINEFKRILDKIKSNPDFIANLVPLSQFELMFLEENKDAKGIKGQIDRLLDYYAAGDRVKVREENVDVGVISKEEVKNLDIGEMKKVIDAMENVDEEVEGSKTIDTLKPFYILPSEYNLSVVYAFSENATFIKTKSGLNIAIIDATPEEVNELMRNALADKPSIEKKYHIISFKPFDKDLVRRTLYEIECHKLYATQVIDSDAIEVTGKKLSL